MTEMMLVDGKLVPATLVVISELQGLVDKSNARLVALDKIAALHNGSPLGTFCRECRTTYPCPTARAIQEVRDA